MEIRRPKPTQTMNRFNTLLSSPFAGEIKRHLAAFECGNKMIFFISGWIFLHPAEPDLTHCFYIRRDSVPDPKFQKS